MSWMLRLLGSLNSSFARSCKIVKAAPAVPVYCSTLILMVIAVDRYHTIVYSRRSQLLPKHVAIIAPVVLGESHKVPKYFEVVPAI